MQNFENISDGPTQAAAIFDKNSPGGGTATEKVIEYYGAEYLAARDKGEAKPVILAIITDGEPNDQQAVIRSIVNLTKKLKTREEFGIQFIQIGDDPLAHAFLKRLDDDLGKEGATLDIVDTKTNDELEGISMAEALMDALTD